MNKLLIVLALMVLGFSCKHEKEKSPTADFSEKERINQTAEQLMKVGEKLPVDDYNKIIMNATAARQWWAYSPIMLAQRLVGTVMETELKKVEAISKSGTELITSVWVVITEENLLDDSIQARQYLIKLDLGGSIWKVTAAYRAHKCREGRGISESFHADLCN